jgi:hypothetical protein
MKYLVFLLFGFFAVAVLIGCGSDEANPTGSGGGSQEEPELPENAPPLPTPTEWGEVLPVESEYVIVEESALKTFIPVIESARRLVKFQQWRYIRSEWETLDEYWKTGQLPDGVLPTDNDKRLAPQGDTTGRLPLVKSSTIGQRCYFAQTIDTRYVSCYPGIAKSNWPKIRKVLVWKKRKATNVEPNTSIEFKFTIETGVESTSSQSLTRSIGGGLTVPIKGVEAALQASLSQQFTSTEKITSKSTSSIAYDLTTDSNTKLMCSAWQLIERYEVVDANGNLWTTGNYKLPTSETRYIDNGLEEYRLVRVVFDTKGNPL